MKIRRIAACAVLVVMLMSFMFPLSTNAARKHKAGDWITKDEFFEMYGLDEFIGWGFAGGSVGEKISNSETGLYPVQIKATLSSVSSSNVAVVSHLVSYPESFSDSCDQLGKQLILSSEPIDLTCEGIESGIATEYGHFSYSYSFTLSDLSYSYSSGFSSLSSPFEVTYSVRGNAEAYGMNNSTSDNIIERHMKGKVSEDDIRDRMGCEIDDSGEMFLATVFSYRDDSDPDSFNRVWVKFRIDEVLLGKKPGKSAGMRISFDSSGDADFADPLTTLVISILALLLSILFGNTGGFIPPVPVGTGGTPTLAPTDMGFGRWLRYDNDGDIEVTDPISGQKRTFVHNGDGTYTDPVSGATYTPEELSEQMEHRADNAETIRQDEAQFRQNVREDSQHNQERSDESKQLEEDLRREKQERTRKEKIERIASDLGMSGASEDEIRQELSRRMERDEDFRQKMNDYAQRRDTAVDILETTVEAVDYGMAIGEVVVPGGKTVSATYKGIKNIGSTVAEKGLNTGAVVEGVIKGGTEAATTVMQAGVGKAVTTIGGTVAGEIAEAVNDGEDIARATAEGLIKGAGNATIGAVSDGVEDAATTLGGKVATKVTETGFSKEVAEPLYDEAFKKDK